MDMTGSNLFLKEKSLQWAEKSGLLLSVLEWLCDNLMEVEVDFKAGASKSERKSNRNVYRSGYRPRKFETRMGTVCLKVPKLRKGGYIPFFVNNKKRSEIELLNVVSEAYVFGAYRYKINDLAKSLGIDFISSEQVSKITFELNKQINELKFKKNYSVS